jgi:hypothetical protein
MFNPSPRIQSLPITAHHACHVIDDALLEPEVLVDIAVRERARFAAAPHNAYPGIELRMQDAFSARLDDFFRLHLRARLGARRTLRMYSRLSLVTLPPSALEPRQCICHRDRLTIEPGKVALASVQGASVRAVLLDGVLARAPAIAEGRMLAEGCLSPVSVDPAKGIG